MKRGRDRDVVDIAHACGIEQHLMLDETMSPAGPKLYLWGLALCDSHNSFHISQSLCKKGALTLMGKLLLQRQNVVMRKSYV
jgi:hypothetical protein